MSKHSDCHDCGLPFEDLHFGEIVLPKKAHDIITGAQDISLCPNCICYRLGRKNITNIEATIYV